MLRKDDGHPRMQPQCSSRYRFDAHRLCRAKQFVRQRECHKSFHVKVAGTMQHPIVAIVRAINEGLGQAAAENRSFRFCHDNSWRVVLNQVCHCRIGECTVVPEMPYNQLSN